MLNGDKSAVMTLVEYLKLGANADVLRQCKIGLRRKMLQKSMMEPEDDDNEDSLREGMRVIDDSTVGETEPLPDGLSGFEAALNLDKMSFNKLRWFVNKYWV